MGYLRLGISARVQHQLLAGLVEASRIEALPDHVHKVDAATELNDLACSKVW